MMARLRPYLLLALLWAAYFYPLVLHPTQTLYADYSDFLAEHLPAKIFLSHESRDSGELPLWNPYHFCGTPFIHDIQVGCFYPPYAVIYVFPEGALGAAMSWVIALHVLAAGALAYLYARSRNLGAAGSFVAGAGFMLSAKWMTHLLLAGHTITVGLAWVPLVLLGLENAIRTGSARTACATGIAMAFLILGTHPQWAFYSILFTAAWTIPRARHDIRVWLKANAIAGVVAILLCAVQLWPTWEASRYSARSAGLESTQSLSLALPTLFALMGPAATYEPAASWESRAIFGVFWLASAVAAPFLIPRLRDKAIILLALVVFSLGGAAVVEWLPGFDRFRVPSRMLLITTFPIAFLAGATIDALNATHWNRGVTRILRRALLLVLLGAAIPTLTRAATELRIQSGPLAPQFIAYWSFVLLEVLVGAWLCFFQASRFQVRTPIWVSLLVGELIMPTIGYVAVRPQSEIYPDSALVRFLAANDPPGSARVLDIDIGVEPRDRQAPLGVGSPEPLIFRFESPRGYNPLDVKHYREFINYIVNRDERLRSLSPTAQPILPNFPRLHPSLFDQLNVRYLVCYEEHVRNPEMQNDPGQAISPSSWQCVGPALDSPLVPALPPIRPNPLPRVLIYENKRHAGNPRAFVVPDAAALPPGEELDTLIVNDFHRTVLLSTTDLLPPNGSGPMRPAQIMEYRPNRVVLDLGKESSGFLVLNDVWFPGWVCRADGVETKIYRANHAFRAVAIPVGAKQVVFTFEPLSYRVGRWISALTLVLILVFFLTSVALRRWNVRSNAQSKPA